MNNSVNVKTILIVEDDIELSDSLKAMFTDKYIVVVAYSLKSAIEHFNVNIISAVLLDYTLPDGSGFDLLKKIRALSKLLPVVVITAHTSPIFKDNMLTQGVNDFLLKPFIPEVLIQSFDRAIEQINILNAYLPIDEIFVPKKLFMS